MPVIPLAMLGFAAAVEEVVPRWKAWGRAAWWTGALGGAGLMGWLAVHSIFEWMWELWRDPVLAARANYLDVSHWEAWASPIAGFATLAKVDVLAVGAVTLARLGYPGLLAVFVAVGAVGLVALARVVRALRRG